jgi:hypothetical protein
VLTVIGGVLLLAQLVGSSASANGGKSADAHMCNQGGWRNLVRTDGTTFTNVGKCASYAAQGGTLQPLTGCSVFDTTNSTGSTSATALQTVITNASDGDAISVMGTCAGGTVAISVTITGQAASGYTTPTLDGGSNPGSSVLTVLQALVIVQDLTITNGATVGGNGGGINNFEGKVNIYNSTISHNTTGYLGPPQSGEGGGIYSRFGTVNIFASTISNNTAVGGGGIATNQGEVNISGSTISNNTASSNGIGGGVLNRQGRTSVDGSTISNNTGQVGGGIDSWGGPLEITNSTISSNLAVVGGGIANGFGSYLGTLVLTNSAVTGNIASSPGRGGGIYNDIGSTVTLISSTVSGNFSPSSVINNCVGTPAC